MMAYALIEERLGMVFERRKNSIKKPIPYLSHYVQNKSLNFWLFITFEISWS